MMQWGHRAFLSVVLVGYGLIGVGCVQPDSVTVDATTLATPENVKPKPAETYLSLGHRLLAAREPDLAMKAFLTSMNVEGISASAVTGAGIAFEQQGLLSGARRYFEQAVQLAPNSVIAHNNLGVALYRLREYYPARDEFRSAFALSSGTSETAVRNLNRTEAMIAVLETSEDAEQPISHEVVNLGGGEFRLVEIAPPEADVMAE